MRQGLQYTFHAILWIGIPAGLLFWLGSKLKDYATDHLMRARHERGVKIGDLVLSGQSSAPEFVLYLRPFKTDGKLSVANPNHSQNPFQISHYSEQEDVQLETILADAF